MEFILAFSTGKDSMLALHRMVKNGHKPLGLLVMINKSARRSWFHGTDEALLEAISGSLGIPLIRCESTGDSYTAVFEEGLRRGRALGAEACVFGDIDIADHRVWNEERCRAAGLLPILPLWQENREALVRETIAAGYTCLIKCLHPEELPERFLGRTLDGGVLEEMRACGIDLCGENGEYHTIVLDGPLFCRPIPVRTGGILRLEHVSAIELTYDPARCPEADRI